MINIPHQRVYTILPEFVGFCYISSCRISVINRTTDLQTRVRKSEVESVKGCCIQLLPVTVSEPPGGFGLTSGRLVSVGMPSQLVGALEVTHPRT